MHRETAALPEQTPPGHDGVPASEPPTAVQAVDDVHATPDRNADRICGSTATALPGPVAGRAEYVEMLGREMLIGVATGSDQRFSLLASPNAPVKPGEQVRFGLDRGRLYLFDATTQRALGTV